MQNGIPKGQMVAITVDTPKMKKHLRQELNTKDDSFTYTLFGENEPTYKVDSSGYLTKKGVTIGKYRLGDNQWHLYLDDVLFMSGPKDGLFYLPEFELKSLTALINQGE